MEETESNYGKFLGQQCQTLPRETAGAKEIPLDVFFLLPLQAILFSLCFFLVSNGNELDRTIWACDLIPGGNDLLLCRRGGVWLHPIPVHQRTAEEANA